MDPYRTPAEHQEEPAITNRPFEPLVIDCDRQLAMLDGETTNLLDGVIVARAVFRDKEKETRSECLKNLIREEAELRIGGIL